MLARIQKFCKKKLRRYINQRHVKDYPDEAGGWTKYQGNPVLGDENTGTMFDPFVRMVNDRYVMCVSRRRDNCLMLYDSEDGVNWKNGRVILQGNGGSDWETEVNRGCFLIRDGKWYLWYTGQHNGESKIGMAVSDDGIHFSRAAKTPVLYPEYLHEGKATMNPCVLWDEDKMLYRMWYAAGENYEPDVICYAESKDGFHWIKESEPIIKAEPEKLYQQYKVGACDLSRIHDIYYMAYIAYQNLDVARICLAKSNDGLTGWTMFYDGPAIGPGINGWDQHAVYKPTLVYDEKKQIAKIWYNGRFKRSERIGLAERRGAL